MSPEPELKSMIRDAMTLALAHDYFPYQDGEPSRTLRAAINLIVQLDLVIDLRQLSAALPKLAEITGTKLTSSLAWENRTPAEPVPRLSWAEFESDNALMSVIGLDRMLYRYAFSPFSPGDQPAEPQDRFAHSKEQRRAAS